MAPAKMSRKSFLVFSFFEKTIDCFMVREKNMNVNKMLCAICYHWYNLKSTPCRCVTFSKVAGLK